MVNVGPRVVGIGDIPMNVAPILFAGLALASPLVYFAYDANAGASPDAALAATADETAPSSQTYEGVIRIGLAVGAPYPLCPLQCTFGYSFLDDDAEDFEVAEGVRTIKVVAHWSATTPATRDLSVGLYRQDDECGEGCYMGMAGDEGSQWASFTLEDPEPGLYHVSARPAGPAYAGARQDVWFEVTVTA